MILRCGKALLLTAGFLLQTQLRADAKKDPDKKNEPKETIVNDELINADLKDKVRTEMYCKTYTYKMIEGRTYQIDMKTVDKIKNFDPYLRLENSDGNQVAFDDDGGGFPDARISYRAPKTGDYTIICTTFGAGMTGKFTLIVKDLTGGPVPKEDKKDGEKKDKFRRQALLGNLSVNGSGRSLQVPRIEGGRGAAVRRCQA
jgi:serine protease Do